MSNLQQRILTAVVLLALFIAALVVRTPWPFLLLTLLLIGAAAWEWSRLIGWMGWRAWVSGVLCAVACATMLLIHVLPNPPDFGRNSNDWFDDSYLVMIGIKLSSTGQDRLILLSLFMTFVMPVIQVLVCLFWIIGVPWLLWRGVARWPALPRWLRWSMGMAMLIVAWFALAQIYKNQGVNFLLSVLALVWVADIGGYVFGRAFGGKLTGGRKLAPAISPGKTWEGALGGFICVLLAGAVWVWFDSASHINLYTALWRFHPLWFLAGLAFFTAMSIVGDLFESLVKRAAGVKDSSQLLPGHGGVLDRIDALLCMLPLTLLVTVPLEQNLW